MPYNSYRVAKIHRIRYDIGHFPPIVPTAEGSFGENDVYFNEAYESWAPCLEDALHRKWNR